MVEMFQRISTFVLSPTAIVILIIIVILLIVLLYYRYLKRRQLRNFVENAVPKRHGEIEKINAEVGEVGFGKPNPRELLEESRPLSIPFARSSRRIKLASKRSRNIFSKDDAESKHSVYDWEDFDASVRYSRAYHSVVRRQLSSINTGNRLPDSSSAPLANKEQALPHHGLFIRRNNAYGTLSTIGIKDIIEQGELIDQTQIRFDDFIMSSSQDIPSPLQGVGLSVNYGLTPIQSTVKHRASATHYLEIALKAQEEVATTTPVAAPPVNYVFAVDTSSSMSGEKIEIVKETLWEIFQQLQSDDVLGIVEFNSTVNTVFKATPKKDIKSDYLSQVIGGIRATGSTDLNLGLMYSFAEILPHKNNNRLNQVYLFSDGNPTSGETNWLRIRQNVAEKARDNTHLSVFGFGTDANMRELDALAGVAGGQFTFVTHSDEVKNVLQNNLNRRNQLVAMNIQLQILFDEDVTIWHLFGHDLITDPTIREAVMRDVEDIKATAREELNVESKPDIITEEDGIRIFAPDLAAGETYWIVFEIEVKDNQPNQPIGQSTVQYVDVIAKDSIRKEIQLDNAGAIPADVVAVHGVGLWTSEVTFFTLDDLYEQDLETAKNRLHDHIKNLENANKDLASPQIKDDIVTLTKFESLSTNLGNYRFMSDNISPSSPYGYSMIALNAFGRSRNGFVG